ncbi:WLM domain-containing protein [Fimicolochytrium jonesii]|uniref:WLM domain-containing protein n=1 Tax=Fimicolochytrium jonesii TaxID=1396493 RepID=UPI0022FF2D24|nr:WLM domain-containing protein [Fimicolochytrium jonesii]KAI8820814.1 WLM domain-containing protein [Fimicolochytrium jonesii]
MAFNEHITHVTALKKYKNHSSALHILHRIASLVKPLMRAHNFHVKTLREFFPTQPNLLGLNVNRGLEIRIRLRPARDPDSFYDMVFVLGTMLHELTHIVRGPHDAKFYQFLDGLNKEYDELVAKGWKGDGFFAPGKRVGQGVGHDLPPHLARQKAMEAAEKRRKINEVMIPAGGRRLGGSEGVPLKELGLSPAQAAAMAAERRAKDAIWCGNAQHGSEKEGDAGGKADEGDYVEEDVGDGSAVNATTPAANEPIWVLDDDEDVPPRLETSSSRDTKEAAGTYKPPPKSVWTEPIWIDDENDDTGPQIKGESSANTSTDKDRKRPRNSSIASGQHHTRTASADTQWPCPLCTLLNRPMVLQCEACATNRPETPPPKRSKGMEREVSRTEVEGWACSRCTFINSEMFRMCSACEYLRQA